MFSMPRVPPGYFFLVPLLSLNEKSLCQIEKNGASGAILKMKV